LAEASAAQSGKAWGDGFYIIVSYLPLTTYKLSGFLVAETSPTADISPKWQKLKALN
jgi:hypothetical protein